MSKKLAPAQTIDDLKAWFDAMVSTCHRGKIGFTVNVYNGQVQTFKKIIEIDGKIVDEP